MGRFSSRIPDPERGSETVGRWNADRNFAAAATLRLGARAAKSKGIPLSIRRGNHRASGLGNLQPFLVFIRVKLNIWLVASNSLC